MQSPHKVYQICGSLHLIPPWSAAAPSPPAPSLLAHRPPASACAASVRAAHGILRGRAQRTASDDAP
eukprot:2111079-Rhodomonas_salina.1